MQTGQQQVELSNKERALISGLIGIFVEQVVYDALIYVTHAAGDESESLESDSDQVDDPTKVDDQETIQEDQDNVGVPRQVYLAAAKRELLSPNGIVHDLELMYTVHFAGGSVTEKKSQDPIYCKRVEQLFATQKLCLTQDNQALASYAFTQALDRLRDPLEESEEYNCCLICDEMESYADQNDAESEFARVLLEALCKFV